jgi:hypothetical protein
LDGKIREVVRFARGKGKGGPLHPDDKCSKTGLPVIDVMRSKHPDLTVPSLNPDGSIDGFEQYAKAPMSVPHASDHSQNCSVARQSARWCGALGG